VLLSADVVGGVDLLNHPILPREAPAVSVMLDGRGPEAGHARALFTTLQSHDAVVGPSFNAWYHGGDDRHDYPSHHGSHHGDGDGSKVSFKLTGPGTSEVVRDGDRWDVVLKGTDSRSVFTINPRGHAGDVKIDDIRVDGSLGQLRAGKADLYGDLAVRGKLHRLELDDVRGGTVSAESIDEIRIRATSTARRS
jgi:hypothetical protein